MGLGIAATELQETRECATHQNRGRLRYRGAAKWRPAHIRWLAALTQKSHSKNIQTTIKADNTNIT